MKALKELDEVITWLGRTGKLTGKNMEKAQKCLVAVSQEYDAMELRDIDHYSAILRLSNTISSLKSLLRCSGYTVKAIEEAVEMGSEFLDKELVYISKDKSFIQDDTAFQMLKSYHRSYSIRIETDIFNVMYYKRLLDMPLQDQANKDRMKQQLLFFKDTYPHLGRFFDMADDREELSYVTMKNWLYNYYMNN